MGCSCDNKVIVLANDSRIESEFNGAAAGYWDASGNWTRPCGATSLLLYVHLLELSGPTGDTVRVSVLVQGSIDGVSWSDLDTAVVRSWTAVGNYTQRLVFPSRASYAPLVRFGLRIENDGGSGQVAARLSVAVTPVGGDHELESLQESVVANAPSGVIAGTEVEVFGVSTLNGRVAASGMTSGQTWNAKVEGSFDGEAWFDTGTTIALTGATLEAQNFSIAASLLPAMVRLFKQTSSATAGTVTIDLLGRGF